MSVATRLERIIMRGGAKVDVKLGETTYTGARATLDAERIANEYGMGDHYNFSVILSANEEFPGVSGDVLEIDGKRFRMMANANVDSFRSGIRIDLGDEWRRR